MAIMLAPIPKGTLVGVQNTVGAYKIIRRVRPSVYELEWNKAGHATANVHRSQIIFPLRPGKYLRNGEPENFVEVE